MTSKPKSRVGTIFLSFIPGVGHMYLGLMQRGLLYMLAFAVDIFLVCCGLEFFVILLPVIWFYQFFDALHCYDLPPYELENMKKVSIVDDLLNIFGGKKHGRASVYKWIGIVLIIIGVLLCFAVFHDLVMDILWNVNDVLAESFDTAFYDIKRVVINAIPAVIVIVLGAVLIRGNRKRSKQKEKETESEQQSQQNDGSESEGDVQ